MKIKYENELILLNNTLYDLTEKRIILHGCLDFSSYGNNYLYINSNNIVYDKKNSFFSNVIKCYCGSTHQYVLLDNKRCFARRTNVDLVNYSAFYRSNELSVFKFHKKIQLFNHTIHKLKNNRLWIYSNIGESMSVPILKLKNIIGVFYNSKLDKIILQKTNFDLLIFSEYQLQCNDFNFKNIKATNIPDWIEYQFLI